ncbi:uncharacterized protein LOC110895990 [Helianthus annuus]|uniref:uncharacterized protein LOC110895990 n=1 Tax=Helianthus annuus TaxID=4232 RepID=UPI000B8FCFB4|nr:uncharacterized protein LOC110895990 [Helianthus annuus]
MAVYRSNEIMSRVQYIFSDAGIRWCLCRRSCTMSRYMDNLVGGEKEFFERSSINFVHQFSCPIILFQGLENKVVPPYQIRKNYQALKAKGLPDALVEYEGEQHGFRKAENIIFTLEQQMVFFARLVGNFKVADGIVPIKFRLRIMYFYIFSHFTSLDVTFLSYFPKLVHVRLPGVWAGDAVQRQLLHLGLAWCCPFGVGIQPGMGRGAG